MRFTVRHDPRWVNAIVEDTVTGEKVITHGLAKAKIIAFALNAVAGGRNLYSRPKVFWGLVPYESEQYTRYDGPTEGVAP